MASHEWYTPPDVYDALGLTYDVDPCSPGLAAIPWSPARVHLTVREDGLATPWWRQGHKRAWMNALYEDMPPWVERWLLFTGNGGTGVTLGPCLTDNTWSHVLFDSCTTALITRKRIAFIPGAGQKQSTPRGNHVFWAYGAEERAALLRMQAAGWGVCVKGDH